MSTPGEAIARRIADLERRVDGIARGSQMSRRSIEGGAIKVYDRDGNPRGSIGVQPDGTTAVVTENDPIPSRPSAPIVEPIAGGLLVEWDGELFNGSALPKDFRRVEIHASPDPMFSPGPETHLHNLSAAGSIGLPLPSGDAWSVTFVATTTGGSRSEPSTYAVETPAALPSTEDVAEALQAASEAEDAAAAAQSAADDAVAIGSGAASEAAAAIAAAGVADGKADQALTDAAAADAAAAAAQSTADDAHALATTGSATANAALASANGKNRTTYSSNEPSGAGTREGDLWFRQSSGTVVGLWRWTGSEWQSATLNNEVLASLDAGKITTGELDADRISANTITSEKIAADAVTAGKILAGEIGTAHLAAEAVTAAKIKAGEVTAGKLAAGAVQAGNVAAGAIQAGNLAAGAVQAGNVAAGAIQAGNIAADAITAESGVIADAAITSAKIVSLDADKITTGEIAAGQKIIAGPESGTHAELSDTGFRVYNGTDEVIRLGTDSDDYFAIVSGDGNLSAAVDHTGRASFSGLTSEGWPEIGAPDHTGVGGTLLEILDRRPRGMVAYGQSLSSVTTNSVSGTGLFEISARLYEGRMYRIHVRGRINATTTDCLAETQVRWTYGAVNADVVAPTPSLSSETIARTQTAVSRPEAEGVYFTKLFAVGPGNGTDFRNVRFLLSFSRAVGTGTITMYGPKPDGPELWVEDIGPFIPNSQVVNYGGGGSAPPAPQRYSKTWAATWVRSYRSNGAVSFTDRIYQGYGDSFNGTQRALIGFPASIATELSGATVEAVGLYLYAEHWWNNSGGIAVVGRHGYTSAPSTYPTTSRVENMTQSPPNAASGLWPKPGGRWLDLMPFAGQEWATGMTRGVVLGATGMSTSPTYYGRFAPPGSPQQPLINITYRK